MKVFFVITICKILKILGGLLGRGSSLPGQIALKLDRNILSSIDLPKYIIAVTGSNGKTSTVEMISHILTLDGKSIAWNKEGSNQIEGVTTLILSNCTCTGKFKKDILLIESDERYAKYTFKYFKPTHYIITNLYRDQLTRNGHPNWVYNAIKDSIHEETTLILNSDDPLVSMFGYDKDNTIWFGVDKYEKSTEACTGRYNDGYLCPKCQKPMDYNHFHYNHIGSYNCTHCGFSRKATKYAVTKIDSDNAMITIDNNVSIKLALNSLYNIYNILAAYSISKEIGIANEVIDKAINNYVLKNGRVVSFKIGDCNGMLLTSKHENSVSYDQSLRYVVDYKSSCSLMIIVDAISRKYFTGETSWLWDINFDVLEASHIENIYLCGSYAYDLATRFDYTDINPDKIKIYTDISAATEEIKNSKINQLFTVTCFSDKDKILSKVDIL